MTYYGDISSCDLVFDVKGEALHCHRSVVCEASEFLHTFFRSDPMCSRVRISNATPSGFRAFLWAVYDAEKFSRSLLPGLSLEGCLSCWEISVRFGVTSVGVQCVHHIGAITNPATAMNVKNVAEKHLNHANVEQRQQAHDLVEIAVKKTKAPSVRHQDLVSTPSPKSSVASVVTSSSSRSALVANSEKNALQVRQRYLQYLSQYNKQRALLEHRGNALRSIQQDAVESASELSELRATHRQLVHDVRTLENELLVFRSECSDLSRAAKTQEEAQRLEKQKHLDEINSEREGIVSRLLAVAQEVHLQDFRHRLEEQKTQYMADMKMWAQERSTMLEIAEKENAEVVHITSAERELRELEVEEEALLEAKYEMEREIAENTAYDNYAQQYMRAMVATREEVQRLYNDEIGGDGVVVDLRSAIANFQQLKRRLSTELQNAEGRVAWMSEKVKKETDAIGKLRESLTKLKNV